MKTTAATSSPTRSENRYVQAGYNHWLPVTSSLVVLGLLAVLTYEAWPQTWGNGFLMVGAGRAFLALDAAAVGIAAVGTMVTRPRSRRRMLAAALVAAVLLSFAVGIYSGNLLSFALAAGTLLAAWAIGDACMRVLLPGLKLFPLVPLALGTGLLSTLIQLLGRNAVFGPYAAVIVVAIPALFQAARLLRRVPELPLLLDRLAESRTAAAGTLALAVMMCWESIWASAPEIQFDALSAKAWLPQHWAYLGRIETFVQHPVLALTGAAQVLALPGNELHAAAVGRFLQFWTVLLIVWAVWTWCQQWNRTAGPVAAAVVGLTPLLVWEASTAYDDAMLAMWTLALAVGVYEIFRVGSHGGRAGVVLGALAGTCVAGKYHLAAFAAVVVLTWALFDEFPNRIARRIVGVAGGFALTGVAGIAYTWVTTGNPVFPAFNNIFHSPYYAPINERFNFPYLGDGSVWSLIQLPWTIIHSPSLLMEAAAPDSFGLLGCALVLALALGWRGDRPTRIVWTALVAAGAFWWLELRYLRYLLPYGIVAVVLLAPLATSLAGRRPGIRLSNQLTDRVVALVLSALAVVLFVPTLSSFWNIPRRVPAAVVLGQQSKTAYLRQTISYSAALGVFVRLAKQHSELLADPLVAGRTLLPGDLGLTSTWELQMWYSLKHAPVGSSALYRYMHDHGVTWALMPDQSPPPFNGVAYWGGVLAAHARMVYAANGWYLLHLVAHPTLVLTRLQGFCSSVDASGRSCWLGVGAPGGGITWHSTSGGPATQDVRVCPGQLLDLRTRVSGRSSIRLFLTFRNAAWDVNVVDGSPGAVASLYATVPKRAHEVEVTVQPMGRGVRATHIELMGTTRRCG